MMQPLETKGFSTLDRRPESNQGLGGLVRRIHATDVWWSEKYLSATPLYSVFWIVRRIRQTLKKNAHFAHGRLLDVGCGLKPFADIFAPYVTEHVGLDYSPDSGYRGNSAEVCGDAAKLPFADGSVDTILCTEMLIHLPEPTDAIREFARVLAPGGTLITTAAFVYPINDRNDYFRFGPHALATAMEKSGLTVERVEPMTGTAVTLASMTNLYWYDRYFLWNKVLYPVGLLLRPLLWLVCILINLMGGLFELIMPDRSMSFDHLTVAHKPANGTDKASKSGAYR